MCQHAQNGGTDYQNFALKIFGKNFQIATPPTVFLDSHKTWHTCFVCQYPKKLILEILILKFLADFLKFASAVELCRPTGLV